MGSIWLGDLIRTGMFCRTLSMKFSFSRKATTPQAKNTVTRDLRKIICGFENNASFARGAALSAFSRSLCWLSLAYIEIASDQLPDSH